MKKLLLCLAACALFMNAAQAINDPVPDYKRLIDLPKGSRVRIDRSISVVDPDAHGFFGAKFGSFAEISVGKAKITLVDGQTIAIKEVNHFDNGLVIELTNPHMIFLNLPKDSRDSTTVAYFNKVFRGTMSIVLDAPYVDPYPDMPAEVKQDLLFTKILTAIKADKYVDALPIFAFMEEQGKPLPESFYYYYIVSLDKSDRGETAKKRGAEFLKNYGKKSKFYNEVLGIVAK